MPLVLDPNSVAGRAKGASTRSLRKINHGYSYPNGLNFRPGFELHDRLVDLVMGYARGSYEMMSRRHDDWNEIDRVLKAYEYIPKTGDQFAYNSLAGEKGAKEDRARRVVMPVSYIALETLLTYMSSAFLNDPIFEYEGTGPEDILGAMKMTAVIQRQMHASGAPLALHTAWRDMFAYGVGYASPRWEVEQGRRLVGRPEGILDTFKNMLFQTGKVKNPEYEILFEGNVIDNIDPYLALPDPNVSAHEIQKGEFFGWIDQTNYMQLARGEIVSNDMFNVKYLRDFEGNKTSSLHNRGERNKRSAAQMKETDPIDMIYMYIDLIPKEMSLGSGDRPETWIFAVGADKILHMAEPLNLTHQKIPVAGGAPDFDGYSAAPLSRLLSIEELQRMVDFLYTSHIENIKRVMNDSLVVDPSLINIHDLMNNRPGKIIRTLKRAWGQGGIKDNAIFQLNVQDATQQNISEALFLMEQAKNATSTMDQLGGNLAPRTSRVSASEAQGVRSSGLSRLERPAQMISYQFMLPLARMMASNTQQFMTQETFIKTTGELGQRLEEDFGITSSRDRVKVNPFDLLVRYDLSAHDGAVPGKSDPRVWIELFQIFGNNPALAQSFDMPKIFKHIAREMGATNVDNFIRRQPQVVPDEEVQRGVEAGNLRPVGSGL